MRSILIGFAFLTLGTLGGFYYTHTTENSIAREVRARCQVSEESRKVLRDEHTTKLARAIQRQKETQAFIDSGRHIPGITEADLQRALRDARLDVRDERELLRHVQPRPCH